MSKVKLTTRSAWAIFAVTCLCLSCLLITLRFVSAASAEGNNAGATTERRVVDEKQADIEAARFTRAEFFSAQALLPYPTAEARNRLADLLGKYPNEPQVYLILSQLDEKLGR